MNDKDKEAFKIWGTDQDGDEPLYEGAAYEAWQAACEYKDNEFSETMVAIKSCVQAKVYLKLKQQEVEKLEAENAELKQKLSEIWKEAEKFYLDD